MIDDFFGLIVAGGAGTMLWPISRSNIPKQLLPLGGNNRSLLQESFLRLRRNIAPERIKTVTSVLYDQKVLEQLRDLDSNYPAANLLKEPLGRDSAPAVLWGTLRLNFESPEAVTAVVWSDQMIRDEDAFDEALNKGYQAVRDGGLVAIGVRPNRPATNLGYINYGRDTGGGTYEVLRFIEKPDLATAERLQEEGNWVWNAGIFVFKVRTLLEEFERLAPALMGYFREQGENIAQNDWSDPELMQKIYARLQKESIDYLVLERTDKLRLIPADLDWSDLGAWNELYIQMTKDENGNALSGNAVTIDTRNAYILAGKRLVTAVGVENLVVVDTDDALLVCDMSRVQDVKRLVETLKENGYPQTEGFEETVRPWGSYIVLKEESQYKVKMLEVKPHQKLSLQSHRHRSEHWIVVEGTVRLTRDNEIRECTVNEHFFVPSGAKHRIENCGDKMARIIEVQYGTYLGEDDIVRYDDIYGRE